MDLQPGFAISYAGSTAAGADTKAGGSGAGAGAGADTKAGGADCAEIILVIESNNVNVNQTTITSKLFMLLVLSSSL